MSACWPIPGRAVYECEYVHRHAHYNYEEASFPFLFPAHSILQSTIPLHFPVQWLETTNTCNEHIRHYSALVKNDLTVPIKVFIASPCRPCKSICIRILRVGTSGGRNWLDHLTVFWSYRILWNPYNTTRPQSAMPSSVWIVWCPDPTLSPPPFMGWKGSCNYWAISWLCWVNSLDFGQSNEIVPGHPRCT